ncbi:MAG: hypothetical protein WCT32_05335 [Patescibacteria group bacterium]
MAEPTRENIAKASDKLIIPPGSQVNKYLDLIDRDSQGDHTGLGPIYHGPDLEFTSYPGRNLIVDAYVIERASIPELKDHSVTAYRNLTGFSLEMLPGMIEATILAGSDHLILPYPGTNNWDEPKRWMVAKNKAVEAAQRPSQPKTYMWSPPSLGGIISGAAASFGFDGIITHFGGFPSAKSQSEGKQVEIIVELDDGDEDTVTKALQAGADKVIVYGLDTSTDQCVKRVQTLINEIIATL